MQSQPVNEETLGPHTGKHLLDRDEKMAQGQPISKDVLKPLPSGICYRLRKQQLFSSQMGESMSIPKWEASRSPRVLGMTPFSRESSASILPLEL